MGKTATWVLLPGDGSECYHGAERWTRATERTGERERDRRRFISGFFGQVFGWRVLHWPTYTEFIVYGLAVVGVPLVALVWWLRARRRAGTRAETGR